MDTGEKLAARIWLRLLAALLDFAGGKEVAEARLEVAVDSFAPLLVAPHHMYARDALGCPSHRPLHLSSQLKR